MKPETDVVVGCRPYYRRTLRTGSVLVILKAKDGRKVRLVLEPSLAALMPAGQSYTLEVTR